MKQNEQLVDDYLRKYILPIKNYREACLVGEKSGVVVYVSDECMVERIKNDKYIYNIIRSEDDDRLYVNKAIIQLVEEE